MQRTLIIIGLLAGLSVTTAQAADRSSKEEGIGIGVGATLGAVSGGPLGAIVGAAIGARLGDQYHRKDERVQELTGSLKSSQQRVGELQQTVADLNGDISSLNADLQQMRHASRPELLDLMKAGIEMDLLFRTNERVLADSTSGRLQSLAASLASMPDIRIQLDGYADERGAADYNEKLSAERATFVRDLLVANRVDASRISTTAHGESPVAEGGADNFALQRRVSMTLQLDNTPSFAANPAQPD